MSEAKAKIMHMGDGTMSESSGSAGAVARSALSLDDGLPIRVVKQLSDAYPVNTAAALAR